MAGKNQLLMRGVRTRSKPQGRTERSCASAKGGGNVVICMKHIFILTVTAVSMALLTSSSFADNCSDKCKDKQGKDNTEEGTAS